jgi:hypothetical protein
LEQSERKPRTFDPTDLGPQESRPEPDERFAGHNHRTQSETASPEESLVPDLPDEDLIIRPDRTLKNRTEGVRDPDDMQTRSSRHDRPDSKALSDPGPEAARGEGVMVEPILVPVTTVSAPAATDAGAGFELPHYPADISFMSGVDGSREAKKSESNRSDETPTVKVTIGRIDVRAVNPPSAPVKSERPKPQPMLSLNNYLQQRRRGER